MDHRTYLEKLENRETIETFTNVYADRITGAQDAVETFHTEISAFHANPNGEELSKTAKAVKQVAHNYDVARQNLLAIATPEKDGWIVKPNCEKQFARQKDGYDKARKMFENFFSGKESVDIAGDKIEAPEELRTLHRGAEDAMSKLKAASEHVFGMAKLEGVGFAVKHNASKFNLLDKACPSAGAGELAMRAGGLIACGVGVAHASMGLAHALQPNKHKDDDQRSKTSCVLELLAALGVGTVALTAGRIR